MLDGVFERRNKFFDIRRQLAMPLDTWPQCDRRKENQGAVQVNRIEIVVEMWPTTAMKSIARSSDTGPTVLPTTRPPDVRAPLVGQKHVSAPIDTLCVPLQAP